MKSVFIALFLTLWVFPLFGQSIARVEKVGIQSNCLDQEREILIYTPSDYDWRVHEYFDVIYVFDSQNREFFDYTTSIISFLTDNSKSYIVVGISSPYNEALDYSRNNDLLPVLKTEDSKERYGKYSGNADNFYNYVSTEVMPYIHSHYRTLSDKIVVGHSLSASFILDSFLKNPLLFDHYIAVSPNLAYDDEVLANRLVHFDYSKIINPTYLYLSNANEGVDYWQEWKAAREKVYDYLNHNMHNKNLIVKINHFPDYNHWSTFPPSLNAALNYYYDNVEGKQSTQLSDKGYDVRLKVKVLNKEDTLYISGNQDGLGNWNPKEIRLNKTSDYEREIRLKLKSPAVFKFTRGSWDSEALVKGTYNEITIKPEKQSVIDFEVEDYNDN